MFVPEVGGEDTWQTATKIRELGAIYRMLGGSHKVCAAVASTKGKCTAAGPRGPLREALVEWTTACDKPLPNCARCDCVENNECNNEV